MQVKIDPASTRKVRMLNTDRESYSDVRRYYLLEVGGRDAIVVVRNGHSMQGLAGRVVSANVGWDVAQPGFCRDEDIGRRRAKVTIYNPIREERGVTLSNLLRRKRPRQGRRKRKR